MPFLIAAVVVVGLLCAVDLLLTLAVIRRLREHTTQLAQLRAQAPDMGLLATGTPLPSFTATSVDGATVGGGAAGTRIVVLLSTTCPACATELPNVRNYLRTNEIARDAAVVVVAGPDNADADRFVADLTQVATVVREPFDGPVTTALSARAFPSYYLVSDGVVRSSAIAVGELVEPVPA
jgi:hypothetical protein